MQVPSYWKLRFVGNAFEAAKHIHGKLIDVDEGWGESYKKKDNDGVLRTYYTLCISEFSLSDIDSGEGISDNVDNDDSYSEVHVL